LILCGILVALLMAELFARVLGPPYEIGDEIYSRHQCDRVVGWRGVPNATANAKRYGTPDHLVSWNSRGMRDEEHFFAKGEGVFRILILGDSMIEANEVTENESSHQVLEDTLNTQAPPHLRFEVINGSILAWGPAQSLIYFRTEGQLYDPDLVLGVWYPANDLNDIIPNHVTTVGPEGGVHCYAPYFTICDGQFDPQPWFAAPGLSPSWQPCTPQQRVVGSILNWVYHHSYLYQRLAPTFFTIYDPPYIPLPALWLDQEQQDERLNYAYRLTSAIYAQLAAEAAQNGAKTALVIAPISQALAYETSQTRRAEFIAAYPPLAAANPRLPNQLFTRLMQDRGLPVLDLHPQMLPYMAGQDETVLHWAQNGSHWNIAGNRLAGELMAQWLLEQGLVPTGGD
jgi:lysophospholipase L1-like esterase